MRPIDLLQASFRDASNFPRNLVNQTHYDHALENWRQLLIRKHEDLCCEDGEASLEIYDKEDEDSEFKYSNSPDAAELQSRLFKPQRCGKKDPICRLVSIHAPHSRAPLYISRDMLVSILSYHQIMPEILDFISTFGAQEYPDFHYSMFRHETLLTEKQRGLNVEDLGRTGRHLQMCYTLKSVEQSEYVQQWPWSVRQTTVCHHFDIESGHALWFIVKGDRLIEGRFMQATVSRNQAVKLCFDTFKDKFASTLEFQLVLCTWASEGWRWYINFLEEKVQNYSRGALYADVRRPQTPPQPKINRTDTNRTKSTVTRQLSDAIAIKASQLKHAMSWKSSNNNSRAQNTLEKQAVDEPVEENASPVSFMDIQNTQFIEEKANEVMLTVKVNANIVSELVDYYSSILNSEDCPENLRVNCRVDLERFQKRAKEVIKELQMQLSRLETLLKLIAGRKSTLNGILEHQNLQASCRLAKKTHNSTEKMEKLTVEMHQIAESTEHETVSMRVITLVTLFFLPGTFISTLMSTDIIRYRTTKEGGWEKSYSADALALYLELSLPFMLATFLVYALFKWLAMRKENREMDHTGQDCEKWP